ncbi:MAG: 30S ribosomal protein S6 [Armatimonadetes bacterium CG2_30_59_28]|nr:30S ribosomal protein S6 [Armatimonadota bacterium]OIO98524.1 MAG: 30S ribosomal protein S6 [Armatimonadetes bacterium CG2_30_59_28]PIU63718.1 MAG: 30S ribosomal protein S6 [Armatimonadetes bacterium CG07_land_8_20_14_0_80_59_28]PIX40709.1 MAG: 30S ribosomal protein S6 [Armatimonadetes bacterium CG_4_8_14_3_um_filter_58_9]PIY43336.1 MAG: 30S ribosomal protein S6 [Armatimonadetes bacterium CG_4_10_14_3_um_filter_59_10]
MRDYELVCILNAGLEDTEIQEMTQRVSGIIQSNDGTVENVRTSEVRRLAYPIKKKTEGVYVVINFKQAPSAIQPLDTVLKLEEQILRHRVYVSDSLPPLAHAPEEIANAGDASVASQPEAAEAEAPEVETSQGPVSLDETASEQDAGPGEPEASESSGPDESR